MRYLAYQLHRARLIEFNATWLKNLVHILHFLTALFFHISIRIFYIYNYHLFRIRWSFAIDLFSNVSFQTIDCI